MFNQQFVYLLAVVCVCFFLHIQIKCLSLTIFVVVVFVEIYLLKVNTLADNMRINVCLKLFGKVVCISRNQSFLYQLNLKLSINVYYKCVLIFSLFFFVSYLSLYRFESFVKAKANCCWSICQNYTNRVCTIIKWHIEKSWTEVWIHFHKKIKMVIKCRKISIISWHTCTESTNHLHCPFMFCVSWLHRFNPYLFNGMKIERWERKKPPKTKLISIEFVIFFENKVKFARFFNPLFDKF